MRIDPNIQRELDMLPVPYEVKKSRDHYFAEVKGFQPIIIGGNHDKTKYGNVKNTVNRIRKIRKELENKGDSK